MTKESRSWVNLKQMLVKMPKPQVASTARGKDDSRGLGWPPEQHHILTGHTLPRCHRGPVSGPGRKEQWVGRVTCAPRDKHQWGLARSRGCPDLLSWLLGLAEGQTT